MVTNKEDPTSHVFDSAVATMHEATLRPEIKLGTIRPPQKIAPFSYALGLELEHQYAGAVPEQSEGDAFGRLILLYDPAGDIAWDGTLRLVAYIQVDMDASVSNDPLLPQVTWSWLQEALEKHEATHTALGGTVTSTASVRYGDISGPKEAHQLELRASWTALDGDLQNHVEAFAEVLADAAGLPPVGITQLSDRQRA